MYPPSILKILFRTRVESGSQYSNADLLIFVLEFNMVCKDLGLFEIIFFLCRWNTGSFSFLVTKQRSIERITKSKSKKIKNKKKNYQGPSPMGLSVNGIFPELDVGNENLFLPILIQLPNN